MDVSRCVNLVGLDRANFPTIVLMLMARSSRAMTWTEQWNRSIIESAGIRVQKVLATRKPVRSARTPGTLRARSPAPPTPLPFCQEPPRWISGCPRGFIRRKAADILRGIAILSPLPDKTQHVEQAKLVGWERFHRHRAGFPLRHCMPATFVRIVAPIVAGPRACPGRVFPLRFTGQPVIFAGFLA